ncbi:hypothetical protein [Psychromonas ossibalaenae]|uniref:hypothetical protein n=1 Tax=Psychromonas ossibalaenae TaxID=444922 RepID=UPI0003682AC6|nr:hypothetical protein [Psychromonas ossibalaenae]
MKKFNLPILVLVLLFSTAVSAKNSFRLENGNILSVGKSKSEIIALAGTPIYQGVERVAIDNGQGDNPVNREVLMYKLNGSIGGLYIVVVTVENNIVVSITFKQEDRI